MLWYSSQLNFSDLSMTISEVCPEGVRVVDEHVWVGRVGEMISSAKGVVGV